METLKVGLVSLLPFALAALSSAACGAGPARVPLAGSVPTVSLDASAVPLTPVAPPAVVTGSEESAKVPVSARDPQWGEHDAPVTIVMFEDLQCPFCARATVTLKEIKDTYGPRKVRLVWKNNPLPFHPDARPAAEAAMTVFNLKGDDAFWQFHDRAFANQQALTHESFAEWASDAGVTAAKFESALATKQYSPKIDEDMALATKVGVNGTPAFRINGVTVSGAQPLDKFKEVIDAQLLAAAQAVAAGTAARDVYATLTNKQQGNDPKPEPYKAEDDKTVWLVPIATDDPVRGSKDALVTVVEFADFQCPFCKRVEATLEQISSHYGGDVRIVWKDNPLPFHPRAVPAALLARFAYTKKGNSAFWDVHDGLFASSPKLENSDLKPIVEHAGLSWNPALAAHDRSKIDAGIQLASDLKASGTPSFFINGVRLVGAQPFEKFSELIDDQLGKARVLVASGVPREKVYDVIMKDGKAPPLPEQKAIPAPDASDPTRGNPNAKVVIQEFADFQCPFCKRVQPTLLALEKQYGNKIKVVWRNLPLAFHANAQLAAEAGQEVFAQKGNAAFWAFHDKLYKNTGDQADLARTDRARIEQLASEVGVNIAQFDAALDSHKHKAKVLADAEIANKVGINGTPAFVINGYYLSGAQPEAAFRRLIDLALKGSAAAPAPASP